MASELAPATWNFGMTMMQASSIDPRKYPDWTAFMAKLEAAEEELAQGRPEDFKMLWTHTDDATLSGGLAEP